MDSSMDCFEVPLNNLEDIEMIPNIESASTSFSFKTTLKDDDCSIVEPTISLGRSKNHICDVYDLNEANDENNKVNNHRETCFNEPAHLVIDLDSYKDNDCMIIDKIDFNKNGLQQSSCNDTHKENELLTEFIEKCLDMENSEGMLRIINRTLKPLYKNADETYKKSRTFNKTLVLLIGKLDKEADKKFLLIKILCEELKLCEEKNCMTLERYLKGKIVKHQRKLFSKKISQKRKKDVINLDDYDDVIDCSSDTDSQLNNPKRQIINKKSSVPIIDVGDTHDEINDTGDDSDIQINELCEKIDDDNDVILIDEKENSNKENRGYTTNSKTENCGVLNTVFPKRRKERHNAINKESTEIDLCDQDDVIDTSIEVSNSKNLPQPNGLILDPQSQMNRIAFLEQQIAEFNKIIRKYEEAEVADDSAMSPYIQSEHYKNKVVLLYKEICKLTGSISTKQHKVRLKVAKGHFKGPVKCLEEFINSNIDENGNPPFPDLVDVLSCVYKANAQYEMGWTKKQIEDEARALFIHYGRTVQKRRQRREWKHLLSYVKEETPDPADHDPLLEARLRENAKIAKKNENDLLDRYARMENPDVRPNTEMRSEQDRDNTSSLVNDIPNNENNEVSFNSLSDASNSNIKDNIAMYNPWSVPVQIVAKSLTTTDFNNIAVNETKESSMSIRASMEHNNEEIISNPEYITNVSNTKHNLEVNHSVNDSEKHCEVNICPNKKTDFQCGIVDICTNNEESNSDAIQINKVTTNMEETKTVTNDSDGIVKETEVPSNAAVDGKNTFKHENSEVGASRNEVDNVAVKKEPLDIASMLIQLGDDYTATVIDIEDPFLVIEISDSSESEDE